MTLLILLTKLAISCTISPSKSTKLPLPDDTTIYFRTSLKGDAIVTGASGKPFYFNKLDESFVLNSGVDLADEPSFGPCGNFILSPNHNDGMRVYKAGTSRTKSSKPLAAWSDHNSYYQSVSGSCNEGKAKMDVTLYHGLTSKTVECNNSNCRDLSEVRPFCNNLTSPEFKKKMNNLYKKRNLDIHLCNKLVPKAFTTVDSVSGERMSDIKRRRTLEKEYNLRKEYVEDCLDAERKLIAAGSEAALATPNISANGKLLGGTRAGLDFFLVEGRNCKPYASMITFGGNKPVFSFRSDINGLPRYIALANGMGKVYLVDTSKKEKNPFYKPNGMSFRYRFRDVKELDLKVRTSYPAFSPEGELMVLTGDKEVLYFDTDKISRSKGCSEYKVSRLPPLLSPKPKRHVR